MLHRYFVEWSAPDYRNAKSTIVLAGTKPSAIKKARTKLGGKVRTQHLHHFNAWRVATMRRTYQQGVADWTKRR